MVGRRGKVSVLNKKNGWFSVNIEYQGESLSTNEHGFKKTIERVKNMAFFLFDSHMDTGVISNILNHSKKKGIGFKNEFLF